MGRHARERLFDARQGRPQPGRDDKVVTSWNGLAIAALADAGHHPRPHPTSSTRPARCAEFVVATHLVDGRLRRTSRAGSVGSAAGVADDYGNLAEGLLALHQATGDARWLAVAQDLLTTAVDRFGAEDGGFHDTSDDAEALFTRPRSAADNAEPSGQSALAGALLTCSALTGDPAMRERADAALAASGQLAARDARFGGWALAVAEAALAGPLQVAVVGDRARRGCPRRRCPAVGLARRWSSCTASPTPRASRCSRSGRSWVATRRHTCVVVSCATPR